ncbi:hypothetical protein M2282_000681 [Variovorax boronicumulans]|nr:hypothetical protein [Variovorax boronicumulans]
MDWARDHLGNDVPAWRGGMSGFGLTCPSCGEPVRRRAGGERRPHFAHYSHRAKPGCDNYFPTQGSAVLTGLGTGIRVPPSPWKRESLSCGLFLAAEAGRTSRTLWLRIPPMNLGTTAVGRVEVQSGLGHRTYQLTDLSAARLVPMVPQVPLATIAGFGDLLPLAAELAGQVGAFAADRNLFYADEKGGRFIFSDEQLEWGARYRLLSLLEIAPSLELGLVLSWKPEGKFGDWHSYELALPSTFIGSKPDLPRGIAEFLGHRIRSPRPRLYVVDPLPHHVEIGGAYVYPVPPESLLLRRSGSGEISVTASTGTVATDISRHGEEWVRAEGLWADACEYTIAIDGREQVIFRVEPCELFCPAGVSVVSGDLSWDLCADAPLDAQTLAARAVNVDCGSARIAAHLARLNNGWILEETRLSLPGGSAKHLYAGSFGEFRGMVPASLQTSEENVVAKPAAHQTRPISVNRWIEQLVIRDYGADGASNVKRYLSNPSSENLYRLGPIIKSRLIPYIRAAKHQQRNRTEGDEEL